MKIGQCSKNVQLINDEFYDDKIFIRYMLSHFTSDLQKKTEYVNNTEKIKSKKIPCLQYFPWLKYFYDSFHVLSFAFYSEFLK